MAAGSTDIQPGQEPKASPVARWLSVLLSLALIALGAVAVRELLLRLVDGIHWNSWLDPLFNSLAGGQLQPWMKWAAVIAAILGILLLAAALRPRARTHRRLQSKASLWARPVDIARYTTATAKRVPGVASASTRVRGKNVSVEVDTNSTVPGLEDSIRQALDSKLERVCADGVKLKLKANPPASAPVPAAERRGAPATEEVAR